MCAVPMFMTSWLVLALARLDILSLQILILTHFTIFLHIQLKLHHTNLATLPYQFVFRYDFSSFFKSKFRCAIIPAKLAYFGFFNIAFNILLNQAFPLVFNFLKNISSLE